MVTFVVQLLRPQDFPAPLRPLPSGLPRAAAADRHALLVVGSLHGNTCLLLLPCCAFKLITDREKYLFVRHFVQSLSVVLNRLLISRQAHAAC
jgi:hypothetical protein